MKTFLERHCTPEWQEFIEFHMQEVCFNKKKFIFKCKDKTEGLYIIKSGFVKISYTQFDGTRRIIRLASAGDVLGHRGIGGDWKYTVAAQTYTKTVLAFIPLKVFITMAKSSTNFLFNFMMFFADELRKSDLRIRNVPIINLLSEALVYNLEAYGFEDKKNSKKLAFTLPRQDLANYVGTTYETIVRKLAELNQDNIIKTEGKSIHIIAIEKLLLLSNPVPKKE